MRRREFIAGAAWFAATFPARAQQSSKTARLAVFSPFQPVAQMQGQGSNRYYRAFFAELRRLGHVEGKNLTVDRYGKEQNAAGVEALAAQVVRSNPDAALAIGPGAVELKAATTAIPIVAFTSDPVALGLGRSLAHPGGNVTGVSVDTGPEIWGKRIELLRELFPSMSKLAYLGGRGEMWTKFLGPALHAACAAARLPLVTALVELPGSASSYRRAIAAAARDGADAVAVAGNPDAFHNRVLIADLIGRARLPAIYEEREFVEVGGLMAYEADFLELTRHSAQDIDAILRGATPGDIPFYQGTKFDLTINLKTAKALGLTVSQVLLAQTNKTIE